MTNDEKRLGADAAAVGNDTPVVSDPATARHTEGPWEVAVDDDDPEATINIEREGIAFATVWNYDDWPCASENERDRIIAEALANAHLIAAAPELLEYALLEEKIADFDCPHDADERCRCGRTLDLMVANAHKLRIAALAKAEGR